MTYPLTLVDFHDGLSLYVPDLELVKSTYEDSIIQNKNTAFPFWAKVWPSSKAMTTFLQSEISLIQSKRVLEIGSGIGLPSFSIASHVAELIISDYSSDAVELIHRNIAHLNLPHAKSMHIDWNAISDDIHADVVLLSDINYNPDDFTPLLSMIQCFIAAGSIVIIATPQRIMINPFVESIKPLIKRSLVIPVEEMNNVLDIGILILSN
jgi:predicted nicotinamide N-methyase